MQPLTNSVMVNDNDSVNMIRHHNKFIEMNKREMFW